MLNNYTNKNRIIRSEIFVLTLLLFLTLIYFNRLIFDKKLFFSGDIFDFFYSQRIYAGRSIKNFSIPYWNKDIFCGVPYIADIQNAFFYPFTPLFYFFSPYVAITTTLVIHITLSGWFSYLLVRNCFSLKKSSALVSSLVYMFSGFNTMHMGHLNQIISCTWAPLILYLYIKFIETKNISNMILAGTALALQFLTGGTQNSFYLLIALFILACLTGCREYSSQNRASAFVPFLALIAVTFIGVAAAAVQLLPTYELTGLSRRSEGLSYIEATADSLSPSQFAINFILPNYFGNYGILPYWGKSFPSEMASFVGILPLTLAIIALCNWKKNRYIFFFGLISLVALLFSFGDHTPLYRFFYNFGFNKFRAPSRFIYIYTLSISVLSGFGLNILLTEKNKSSVFHKILKRVLIGLLLVAVLCVIFFLIEYPIVGFNRSSFFLNEYKSMWRRDAIFTSISIISLFFLFEDFVKTNLKALLAFVTIFITLLNFVSQSEFHNSDLSAEFVPEQKKSQIIKYLRNDNDIFRVFRQNSRLLPPNQGIIYEISDVEGYGGGILPLKRFLDLISLKFNLLEIQLNFITMLNVKYILSDEQLSIPGYTNVLSEAGTYLYKNSDFIKRIFLADNWRVIKEESASLDYMATEKIDYKNYVILKKEPLFHGNPSEKSGAEKSVLLKKYSSNLIEVETDSEKEGILFISESYYPGWEVSIDGKKGEILVANHNFRGVALNKGRHVVHFFYNPKIFYKGGVISGIMLLAGAVIIVVRFFKREF